MNGHDTYLKNFFLVGQLTLGILTVESYVPLWLSTNLQDIEIELTTCGELCTTLNLQDIETELMYIENKLGENCT